MAGTGSICAAARSRELWVADLDAAARHQVPDGQLGAKVGEDDHLVVGSPELGVDDLAHAAAASIDRGTARGAIQVFDSDALIIEDGDARGFGEGVTGWRPSD